MDDFATVLADPRIVWLITRRDRVGVGEEATAARAGRRIERVTTPFPQVYYALFRIDAQGTR